MTMTDTAQRDLTLRLYHDHERDGVAMSTAVGAAIAAEARRIGLSGIAVAAAYDNLHPTAAGRWAEGRITIRLLGFSPAHDAADASLLHLEAAAVGAVHSVDDRAEVDEVG